MSPKSPTLPPSDRSLTIPEILDFNLDHNPDQPVYVFSEKAGEKIKTITQLEFSRACQRVAHALRPGREGQDSQVVGVILLSDTIVYQAITAGLMKAGLVPFPISPRNSPPAVVHLLKKISCHRIVVTQETLRGLIDGVKSEFAKNDPDFELRIEEMPSIDVVYPKLGAETESDPFKPYPPSDKRPGLTDTALYLHSSGSTGFPKPIPATHLALFEWASFGITHQLRSHRPRLCIGVMASPSFHTLGIYAQLLQPLYGVICASVYPPTVFSPKAQPVAPTTDNILDHLRRTKSNALITIPGHFQIWSHDEGAVDLLKTFAFVGYSGGPVSEKLGSSLAAAGVNLKAVYGGTEFGAPTLPQLERGHEEDWEWMEFSDRTKIKWVHEGDGKYECQFLTCDTHHPSIENMEDPKGYATSDLFEKHPTKDGLWRVVGRKDDVIMHSSGEKTVPAPMEEVINSSRLVSGVVMFGRKHDQAGVLIETTSENRIDPTNQEQLAALRNKLWPVIEEANRDAPTFSRIFKEMVVITSTEKPLPRSPKGTVSRQAALKAYEEEIEGLYSIVESSAGGDDVTPPDNWQKETVKQWVLDQAKDIQSGADFTPSKDLFDQGFDSLSATFLRLRIAGALRSSKELSKAAKAVAQNTVYLHPTVDSLTEFIVGIVADPGSANDVQGGLEAIEEMIEKYTSGLDDSTSQPTDHCTEEEAVVLVTGSTGNLGAQILANLLQDKAVRQVYALNRPSSGSQTTADRHKARFEDKGLDTCLLKSKKLVFVEGDTADDRLGLKKDMYEELRGSVTVIIHGAWRLDFNLTLASFEPNVRGTRNLIDLARSGPYASTLRFLFTSSVSSAQAWDQEKGPYPEEVVDDANFATGGGYGEGKYVAERILAQSGLQACSIRIGQVSGGLPNGAWATSDWVPILVKSSMALGALPEAAGVVSWLPMDAVCRAIMDIAFTKEPLPVALNLVHPRPITWKSVISSIGEAVVKERKIEPSDLPLVPLQDWVDRLEERAKDAKEDDLKEVPAIKLIQFFGAIAKANPKILEAGKTELESGGLAKFATVRAQKISKTMKDLDPIGGDDAQRWIRYWNAAGFFD